MHHVEHTLRVRGLRECEELALVRERQRVKPEQLTDALHGRTHGDSLLVEQDADPRYAGEPIPATECLKDVLERMLPYWEDTIVPEIKTGKVVLIAAHGNSLRAIVKHLDGISDDDIAAVNIPTGIPLVYELDEETLKPIKKGGRYLDPEAEAKIAAVANQGK